MAKCRTCQIEILDDTEVCPLCKSILEPTDPVENMYPDLRIKMMKMTLFSNIYLFLAICCEAVLIAINILTKNQIWWSAIPGLVLLYFYFVIRYAIRGKSGHRAKISSLTILAVASTVAIDMVSGYRGWSVEYVIPFGIVIVDFIILICMRINRRNWQSYMMWQVLMMLCSIIPILLYFAELEENRYLVFLPMMISVALFLGTLIIGDRRARTELKRRFHV